MRNTGLIVDKSLRNNLRSKVVLIAYIVLTLMLVTGMVISLGIFLIAPAVNKETPDRKELESYLGIIMYSVCFIGLGINMNSFAFQAIVREKSRGNIEALLATPLRAADIWVAKSLAVFIPGLVVGEILAFITMIVINYKYFVPGIGFLFNPWIALSSFLAAPLVYLALSFLVYLIGLTGKPASGNVLAQIFLPVMISLMINLAVRYILDISSWTFMAANLGIAAVIALISIFLRTRLTSEKIVLSR